MEQSPDAQVKEANEMISTDILTQMFVHPVLLTSKYPQNTTETQCVIKMLITVRCAALPPGGGKLCAAFIHQQ